MSYSLWWKIVVFCISIIGTPLYLLRMGEQFSLFMCIALAALTLPAVFRRDDD